MKIVILCAGRGSRLGSMTDYIPKAIITINRKPVISYIIDHIYNSSFQEDLEVAIAVGYKAEVLENYLKDFYSDKKLTLVKIDKSQGKGSGPGYSLLQMKEFVAGDPFILILGDTLCFDDLTNFLGDYSTIGVYKVEDSARFTTCKVDEQGFIKDFYDKVENAPSDLAIIGLYYIKESALYFEGLEKSKDYLIKDELQISNGLNYLLKNNMYIKALKSSWLDTGIEETLNTTRCRLGDCDTVYKNNSLTIIQSGKIRKYGFDESFDDCIKYYKEIQTMPAASLYDEVLYISEKYPKYFDFKFSEEQKLTSIFLEQKIDNTKALKITTNILKKLRKYLYTPQKEIVNVQDIEYEYKNNILNQLKSDKAIQKYYNLEELNINGKEQVNPIKLLSQLDIKQLIPPYYVPIHGKLYFGNVLYDLNKDSFKLIYPKMKFGDSFIYGDYTYDLAMIKQCFNGKYNMIKANKFNLTVKKINNFNFEIHENNLINFVNQNLESMVAELYTGDNSLINRINLLEGILFLYNITQVDREEQKLAFFLTSALLMNKV